MAAQASSIGFSPAQWDRIRQDYTAWWRGDLDRALVRMTRQEPGEGGLPSGFLPNWPEMSDDEFVAKYVQHFSRLRHYGDAMPYIFVNYGAGAAAAFLGSRLHATPETIWFERLPLENLSDIRIAFDADNPWWRRVKHVSKLLADRLGDRIQISQTDIGGNLDTLASLRGTNELLMDLLEQPDQVGRLCREITDVWLRVYDELHRLIAPRCPGSIGWAPTWSPGRTYMLQCDFSYMISPALFGKFVVPDLKACCDRLDYGFYHLDGIGELPHLDQLLAIPNLHGIQWIPGAGKPEAAEWPEVLGKIREAGKRVQIFCTPEGALNVLRRHGGKGFLLAVPGDGLSDAQARQFIRDAQALG